MLKKRRFDFCLKIFDLILKFYSQNIFIIFSKKKLNTKTSTYLLKLQSFQLY